MSDGAIDGTIDVDGISDGATDGTIDGTIDVDGMSDGPNDGAIDGTIDGAIDGESSCPSSEGT
jgi:hypothetical protein